MIKTSIEKNSSLVFLIAVYQRSFFYILWQEICLISLVKIIKNVIRNRSSSKFEKIYRKREHVTIIYIVRII